MHAYLWVTMVINALLGLGFINLGFKEQESELGVFGLMLVVSAIWAAHLLFA